MLIAMERLLSMLVNAGPELWLKMNSVSLTYMSVLFISTSVLLSWKVVLLMSKTVLLISATSVLIVVIVLLSDWMLRFMVKRRFCTLTMETLRPISILIAPMLVRVWKYSFGLYALSSQQGTCLISRESDMLFFVTPAGASVVLNLATRSSWMDCDACMRGTSKVYLSLPAPQSSPRVPMNLLKRGAVMLNDTSLTS